MPARATPSMPRGCSQTPPTVTVGASPFCVTVDQATHTVYVANLSGSVSVFDDRTCNATVQTGCGAVSTLQIPAGTPDDVEVNPATDTVYVAAPANSGPNLIWVFDGATCNASDRLGCGQTPASIKFAGLANGGSSAFLAVDAATNTVYATDFVLQQRPARGRQRVCNQRRHLRCGEQEWLRPDARDGHAQPGAVQPVRPPRPGAQPDRDRGRPGHRHDLHREPRRRGRARAPSR